MDKVSNVIGFNLTPGIVNHDLLRKLWPNRQAPETAIQLLEGKKYMQAHGVNHGSRDFGTSELGRYLGTGQVICCTDEQGEPVLFVVKPLK